MLSGILFGIFAGGIPGPVTLAIIIASLQQGRRMGLIVALMPLLAELPIIAAIAYTLSLGLFPPSITMIVAIVGSLVLLWIGYTTIKSSHYLSKKEETQSLITPLKAFLIAFLNPNPYIFWLTAGAGLMQQEIARGGKAIAVVIGFFVSFLAINIAVALAAHWIRKYLNSVWYKRVIAFLGGVIILLGIHMLLTTLF